MEATAATASDADADADADAAEVERETSLFESFTAIPSMAGAVLAPDVSDASRSSLVAHVATTQRDLAGNRARTSVASISGVPRDAPPSRPLTHPAFGIEERGVLLSSISPSGTKRLVVRGGKDLTNGGSDRDGCVALELWSHGALTRETLVPAKTHGAVCADGTFGGVSWSAREGRIAYVAEAPVGEDGPTPEWGMGVTTTTTAAKKKESEDAAAASNKKGWRGRGEWREEWGEQLVGKTSPACFVLECATGEVTEVSRVGLPEGSVAASGPIWAPADEDDESDALVLPTWRGYIENFKSTSRRLGLTFCFNRPSEMFLMDVPAPRVPAGSGAGGEKTPTPTPTPTKKKNPAPPTRLAKGDVSALWPRFTPDGTALVFISHAAAVESGAHNATCALRKIAWTPGVGPQSEASDVVVPVVRCVLYTGPHTTAFAW